MLFSVTAWKAWSRGKDDVVSTLRVRLRNDAQVGRAVNPFAEPLTCPVYAVRDERTTILRVFG